MNQKIKLAIVDDEALIVQLLTDYFNRQDETEVCVQAGDGQEFIDLLQGLKNLPEVVLLDLRMKELNGVQTANLLKDQYPDIKVIVISSHYQKSFIGHMLRNGIDAFLPKGINPQELKGHYFTDEHIETMRQQISSRAPKPSFDNDLLSEREKEVLRCICLQATAKEIAEQLFITKRTVEGHKNNLMIKTGARNSAGLVIYAIQNGLFDPKELIL